MSERKDLFSWQDKYENIWQEITGVNIFDTPKKELQISVKSYSTILIIIMFFVTNKKLSVTW